MPRSGRFGEGEAIIMGNDDVYIYDDEVYEPPTAKHAPGTFLDFVEAMAPIAKYYAFLLFFWYLAKWFNAAVEREADSQERTRPVLSKDLVDLSSDEEGESDEESEDEIYEELVTDGSRLVTAESQKTVRERKTKKVVKPSSSTNKSHPLFEGLKKVEEELREQREKEKDEPSVSWNDLHKGMLKRYQQKYPEHGLRTADGDDYDDEFKELLKKHNVNIEDLKKQQ